MTLDIKGDALDGRVADFLDQLKTGNQDITATVSVAMARAYSKKHFTLRLIGKKICLESITELPTFSLKLVELFIGRTGKNVTAMLVLEADVCNQ